MYIYKKQLFSVFGRFLATVGPKGMADGPGLNTLHKSSSMNPGYRFYDSTKTKI